MRDNPVKRKLAEGGIALGTGIFEFPSTGIARLAAAAGAEFLFIDQEHTGWSVERVKTLLAAARASEIVPLVRPPAHEYDQIARVLDVGAMGIALPSVESAEQAKAIVAAAKYPPVGRRGFGLLFRDDWEPGGAAPTIAKANEEIMVVALIETARGIENVEAIAAVDGIDVLWLGHNDLSVSLGIPGEFENPTFTGAVDRLVEAATHAGKALGFMVGSVDEGLRAIERGFRCVAYSGDLWLYQSALREGLAQLDAARSAR